MAKRQRGSRPGQRAPLQRGGRQQAAPAKAAAPARAAAPGPAGGLSDVELERAAEIEARIVDEERAAAAATSRGRDRRRSGPATGSRSRPVASLAVVADEEIVWVVRDLRRIALVFATIFSILVASWLLIAVAGVVKV